MGSRKNSVIRTRTLLEILVLFSIPVNVYATSYCKQDIAPGSCEYYNCEENNHRFGRAGYFTGFGYPYCRVFFTKTWFQVNADTQAWMTRVGECLQRKLWERHSDDDTRKQVLHVAIESHSECYLETGGCDLPVTELAKVINSFRSELLDPSIAIEGIEFLAGCARR